MAPLLKAGVFLIKSYVGLNYTFSVLNCTHLGTSHNKDLWKAK